MIALVITDNYDNSEAVRVEESVDWQGVEWEGVARKFAHADCQQTNEISPRGTDMSAAQVGPAQEFNASVVPLVPGGSEKRILQLSE